MIEHLYGGEMPYIDDWRAIQDRGIKTLGKWLAHFNKVRWNTGDLNPYEPFYQNLLASRFLGRRVPEEDRNTFCLLLSPGEYLQMGYITMKRDQAEGAFDTSHQAVSSDGTSDEESSRRRKSQKPVSSHQDLIRMATNRLLHRRK
jgi:hypothetical protein